MGMALEGEEGEEMDAGGVGGVQWSKMPRRGEGQ